MARPNDIFRQLLLDLRRQIIHAFRPGERITSERSLATLYGVSKSTLHRAFVALQSEGLIRAHAHRGWVAVGRRAQQAPLGRKSREPLRLGLISRRTHATWGDHVIYGALIAEARRRKVTLVEVPNERRNTAVPSTARIHADRIPWNKFDVALLVEIEDPATLTELGGIKRRVLAVDQDATIYGIDSVTIDNFTIGRIAVEHLYELGHRRFAVGYEVNDPGWPCDQAWSARRYGVEATAGRLGCIIRPELGINICRCGLREVLDNNDSIRAAAKRWAQLPPRQRPTALYCEYGGYERMLLDEFARVKLKVPRHFSLIMTHWDSTVFALPGHSITHLRPSLELLVRRTFDAAETLAREPIDKVRQPRLLLTPVKLESGTTVAAPTQIWPTDQGPA